MDKQTSEKTQTKQQLHQVVAAKDLKVSLKELSVSSAAFSDWVRSLSQNWRQGTVACKGRSDVSRTGKKPWKQKGTGRARAGSFRSPLWRGGGVIFGPQKRSRTLKISKQVKQKVLGGILAEYLKEKRVYSLNWTPSGEKPKTAEVHGVLKKAGLLDAKVVFFLPQDDVLVRASCANIPNVNVLFFDQANAFDLANSARWVYLNRDSGAFKEMVSRWI